MKNIKSIQIKALFLLVVFSLNIVVGFACSVGMDMGYNSNHHEEEMSAKNSTQHHDEIDDHHDDSKECPNNCCKDKVTKIIQSDKLVPQSYTSDFNPVFLTSFISAFYNSDISPLYLENEQSKYLVRSTLPTIRDIRVAIQSFLI